MRRYPTVIRTDVTCTGAVKVVQNVYEETPCHFDMTDFPRDTQQCQIHLYHADVEVSLQCYNIAY